MADPFTAALESLNQQPMPQGAMGGGPGMAAAPPMGNPMGMNPMHMPGQPMPGMLPPGAFPGQGQAPPNAMEMINQQLMTALELLQNAVQQINVIRPDSQESTFLQGILRDLNQYIATGSGTSHPLGPNRAIAESNRPDIGSMMSAMAGRGGGPMSDQDLQRTIDEPNEPPAPSSQF